MKIAIITINKDGWSLAKKLKGSFADVRIFNTHLIKAEALKNFVKRVFNEYDGLIFISALGITVRLIGPLVKDKLRDPAVVSIDSAGRFAISVLCGHEGGANNLAFLVAACLGAIPVVTTGTEVHKKFIIGIGARRGIKVAQVKLALRRALEKKKIKLNEIRLVATIDLKKNEQGLIKACVDLELPLVFISKNEIKKFNHLSVSRVARRHLGVDGVCEPCALLAGRRTKLIAKKEIFSGVVTIAIAGEN